MEPRERAERPRQTTRSVGRRPTEPGAKESNVRLGQSGGGENVNDLPVGRDRLAHELAHGGVDLLGRLAVAAALLVQRGLDRLEPSRLAGGETDCRQAARRANPPRGGG